MLVAGGVAVLGGMVVVVVAVAVLMYVRDAVEVFVRMGVLAVVCVTRVLVRLVAVVRMWGSAAQNGGCFVALRLHALEPASQFAHYAVLHRTYAFDVATSKSS